MSYCSLGNILGGTRGTIHPRRPDTRNEYLWVWGAPTYKIPGTEGQAQTEAHRDCGPG